MLDSRANILVIEDSQVQANALRAILQNDYDVECVHSAAAGMVEIHKGIYDLVLLDMILPDDNGMNILLHMKEQPNLKNVPVIFITSVSAQGFEEKGLASGAVDYITKPFSPTVVQARIKVHITLQHYIKELEELTMIDQLTGIGNRRSFDKGCQDIWNRCSRSRSVLSIAMMDIDNFKTYNDTFGHPEGDKVIAAIAGVLKSGFRRSTDLVARYGGEEFIVIMTDCDAKRDYEHVCRLRSQIEDLAIEHNPIKQPFVTVSVGGITVFPRYDEDVMNFVKLADVMLYKAKELGRNRVIWTSDRSEIWKEKE